MIEVKEDYSLKPYNTFAIDVKCRYFVESDEEEALRLLWLIMNGNRRKC